MKNITDNIASYREGSVVNDIVFNLGCCAPGRDQNEIFHYIELIYNDGGRLFAYSDENGFMRFEQDFHSKRFGSFHEFFTTEEPGEEDRDGFKLKYYIRRPEASYIKEDLDIIRTLLKDVRRLDDRVTKFREYDRNVNYHM